MKTAVEIFDELATQGSKAIEIFNSSAFSPEISKTLRTWGISEVSEMVGRTPQYIRNLEQTGALPQPQIDSKSKRRVYTLEAINMMREKFGTAPKKLSKDETSIIAFANFKGGAAKTTSSVICSQYLAKKGYRVLFIDCDSQGSASQIFGYLPGDGVDAEKTLKPYLLGEIESLSSVIKKTYWHQLDLIPANLSLYGAEFELPVRYIKSQSSGKKFDIYNILQIGLEPLKEDYDYIILDCPPSHAMLGINAIYAANSIVIPTPPGMIDLKSTIEFFDMLADTLSALPDKYYRFVRLMITQHDGRLSSNAIVDSLRQLYGNYVMTNMMYQSEVINKAATSMLTIYELTQYEGSKKTLDRVLLYADALHQELESIIKQTFSNQINPLSINEAML